VKTRPFGREASIVAYEKGLRKAAARKLLKVEPNEINSITKS
jgi:hypothetical protein